MKRTLPIAGGTSVGALIYAFAEFGVHNLDVLMAALGPFAFRIAPAVPYLDATAVQRIYIALAILSALIAAWTLLQRAKQRFL
ncbi:hypothetical protein [Halobellus limi]|uniref:Uncharacterized protein n=1 Tax=Halobellus limi TaxID=699433 RepID=A0A1H5SNS4_9EURY|nr:hypothetical protein [Halobellus limi]QCC47533.1 hypothetical protein DV707_07580 [Halobellus limi]SEF52236.1 hypothetical protein SAMN04488133_0030 [Halobellus limi]